MPIDENFIPQITADGSFTFTSAEFGESFHSHYGAKQESFRKFIEPTQLAEKANKPRLRLLDVCYGLGYNTAAALQTIWKINPNCYVEIIGLELNAAVPQAAIAHNLFKDWDSNYTEILSQMAMKFQVENKHLKATLILGDARNTIQQVYQSGFQADAIFLDPFSPPQCPHLWTIEFIKLVSLCLHEDGLLATYSCAAAVRTALLAAGLVIASTPPVGRRTPGTVAFHLKGGDGGIGAWEKELFSYPLSNVQPLSQSEKEHLQTNAAIPYRDLELSDPAPIILRRREQEQQDSCLEPTSRWRKRWLLKGQEILDIQISNKKC
jgi:tRNA U34 5-methylaminomethyl-2-thiouridine-forming methyltransferase MnmC